MGLEANASKPGRALAAGVVTHMRLLAHELTYPCCDRVRQFVSCHERMACGIKLWPVEVKEV